METKLVKFNRKKHKRDSWITYGILKSVNRKNILYKKKKTGSESNFCQNRNLTVIKTILYELSIKPKSYILEQNLQSTEVPVKKQRGIH